MGELVTKELHHALDVCQNVVVPESDDSIAQDLQVASPLQIIRIVSVLAPINFDDQHSLPAAEVHDVRAYGKLSYELEAPELSAGKTMPQSMLSLGHVAP